MTQSREAVESSDNVHRASSKVSTVTAVKMTPLQIFQSGRCTSGAAAASLRLTYTQVSVLQCWALTAKGKLSWGNVDDHARAHTHTLTHTQSLTTVTDLSSGWPWHMTCRQTAGSNRGANVSEDIGCSTNETFQHDRLLRKNHKLPAKTHPSCFQLKSNSCVSRGRGPCHGNGTLRRQRTAKLSHDAMVYSAMTRHQRGCRCQWPALKKAAGRHRHREYSP